MKKKDRTELLESPRKEIVKFLETKGWKVLVAGRIGMRQCGCGYNYEFIFEFMGAKKEKK